MSTRRRFDRVAALVLAGLCVGSVASGDDSLEPYRDRFRQGMEKYKAGAIGEAIRAWSAIYEEIGPQRGYRLSFDLARAYEANSETSRAAERYQSFLDEAAARRAANETLDPIVEREEKEATTRLLELNATSGRIRIVPDSPSVVTQIDSADPRLGTFVSYVAPGKHVVVFAPGSADEERREVTVEAGQVTELAPTVRPDLDLLLPPMTRPEANKVQRLEVEHPFSPIVLYAAMGASAAGVVVPVITYAHAYSLIDTHNAAGTSIPERVAIEKEYPSARTAAYATLSVPIGLAAVTLGLATYYFSASKERAVQVAVAPLMRGAVAGVSREF